MSLGTRDTDLDVEPDAGAEHVEPEQLGGRGLRLTLLSVIAIAVLVLAGTAGWLLRGNGSSTTSSPSAVDVGFAQDMSTHHTQAVTMAGYERDNTSNSALRVLATDIETSQQFQIGEMQGWLDGWNKPRNNSGPQMAWMNHSIPVGQLMPGMATEAQMRTLQSLHGKALDILFLQLMIHHHQGGIFMAKYARDHARTDYVVRLAGAMYTLQSDEITTMEQLLRQMGGTPLPPPND